jgi:uncharacterized protein YndB with AHSA1/START domain
MVELRCEANIRWPAEKIFDVITDFSGQDQWLAKSSSFRGTTPISPGPVAVGATYREPGPFGVRNGTVTEVERPAKITFHQPMTLKLGAGTIDVTVRYTLMPAAGLTHMTRVVTLGIPSSLRLFQPLLIRAFRQESSRTLLALKAYADGQAG